MRLQLVSSNSEPEELRTGADLLDDLYKSYASDVKRWTRRLAGPRADIEDLMHDVFVIAIRRGFSPRNEGTIKTWLFRITHHVVRSKIRRGFIRRLLFNRHSEVLVTVAPTPATPHEEIERRERHLRLYNALDQLADCYRTTLILYEIEGMSGEEVAELTGVNVGTVWVRLHRGRAMLLEALTKEERR
jgi:RNA polymerase sigma factor (sigma-70 family)